MLDKHPIGLKSYKHRRDIVFSQAVGLVESSSFEWNLLSFRRAAWCIV